MKSTIVVCALTLFLFPLNSFVLAQETVDLTALAVSLDTPVTNETVTNEPELNLNFGENPPTFEDVTETGYNDPNPNLNWAEKESEIKEQTFSNAVRVLLLGILFIGSAILGLVFYDRHRAKQRRRTEGWG